MFEPLEDRVIIEPDEAEKRSPGGIVIPEKAQQKASAGKVVAVGPGRMLESGNRAPMTVKIGDRVIFGKYISNELEVNGKKLYVLHEGELFAIERA